MGEYFMDLGTDSALWNFLQYEHDHTKVEEMISTAIWNLYAECIFPYGNTLSQALEHRF